MSCSLTPTLPDDHTSGVALITDAATDATALDTGAPDATATPADASEPHGADTLASSVVVLLVMTVLQRVIGFGRGMLFCRWLDSEQLGLWDIAFGFINLAAPFAVLGLPGSFGRYVEYYRNRGQMRTFLRRTAIFSTAMTLLAVGAMVLGRDWCAWLVFNRTDLGKLVIYVAGTLAAVIAFNSVTLLLISLRQHRLVNTLQFFQSLGFALLSVLLFNVWQTSSASAVVAYAASSVVCMLAVTGRLTKIWRDTPETGEPLAHSSMWSKVVPFALWVWVTNVLYNLFDIVDRYMILHCSGLDSHEALRQVGNYHTSRIIPVLLGAVAGLLGAMLTPHLSNDWGTRAARSGLAPAEFGTESHEPGTAGRRSRNLDRRSGAVSIRLSK